MSGEGIAAIIASVGSLATALGTVVLQLRQTRITSQKIDANTALTQATAEKVDEVHAATTVIVEATGSHKILP